MMFHEQEEDRLATPQEACREFAYNYGSTRPEKAWVLTDFDTWEPNPHYAGPPVPHPESVESQFGLPYPPPADEVAPCPVVEVTCEKDIPF